MLRSPILIRISHSIITLFAMSIAVFLGVYALGNPVDLLINPQANQIERAQMITQLGLDQSLWVQYQRFLSAALHGNWGISFDSNTSAWSLIVERLPATVELALCAMCIAIIIGLPLGLIAGLHPSRWYSRLIMNGSILGFSLPTFWVGLMLIMMFSVWLGWLPSSGRGATTNTLGIPLSITTIDGLMHLILPAINLALFKLSLLVRLTKSSTTLAMLEDYVRYARAKGLTEHTIIIKHVLPNIAPPIITIIGLELGGLIAFAIVTESVFSWPGMGKLLIESINMLDRPVIVAYLMMIVSLFIAINLIVDTVLIMINPRLRKQALSLQSSLA